MVTNGTNGNGKKREETAARIIKALGESHGLLTLTAQKTGLGYRTVCRYVAEFPSVKEAAQEAHEWMVDFAESKLYQKIKDGDNACIIFYLKCQAKDRGYVERQEVSGPDGGPVQVEHEARGKLLSAINRIASRGAEAQGDPKPQ